MSDPQQCSQLVNKNFTLRQALALKKSLGPSFGVIMGNATGRYVLDLENESHRVTARKIAELNNFEKRFSRTKSGRGDTSQKGNWENFRNETFNGKIIKLDSNWFTRIPRMGKLKVDYVSTTRCGKAAKPLSDRRFKALLEKLKLHEIDFIREWYDEYSALEHQKHANDEKKKLREEMKARQKQEKKELDLIKLRGVGAVTSLTEEQKTFDRNMKRKTAASVQSTPAIDALTRSARKFGFFEDDEDKKKEMKTEDGEAVTKESVTHRIQSRRKAIDATLLAPKSLQPKQGLGRFPSKSKGLTTLDAIVDDLNELEDDDESDEEGFFDHTGVKLRWGVAKATRGAKRRSAAYCDLSARRSSL